MTPATLLLTNDFSFCSGLCRRVVSVSCEAFAFVYLRKFIFDLNILER